MGSTSTSSALGSRSRSGSARFGRLPPIEAFGRAGDAGATEHYADPRYYTWAYRARRADVAYYSKLAQEVGGPVLEYGAGNGRVTLPLARLGYHVTAVDRSAPMLADLERRLRREPAVVRERVRLERADMRAWHAERRFRLIIAPFNTLLHLYTQRDIQRFLARVRRHLAQGGSFACDCSMPSSDELSGRVRRTRPRRIWHPSRKTWVDYSESFEYDPDRQLLLIWFSFTPRDGGPGWAVPLTHRQLFPCELEASLCYAGFRQVTLGGDFRPGAAGTDVRSVLARCW